MTEKLKSLARSLDEQLSNLGEPVAPMVEARLKTVTFDQVQGRSLEIVSTNQLETNDWCTICMEDYISGGSSEVVRMLCSHT
ncbi:hypothetical protein CRG98_032410 [Punica granatum]|uniref:Uncharacterized protein n=1 Tax=Punica granatum TaxID=22663 RepID=A0A2I0IT56_PUNGR|nr:hypothetical protein CRG98_032410 [Punica granatum]